MFFVYNLPDTPTILQYNVPQDNVLQGAGHGGSQVVHAQRGGGVDGGLHGGGRESLLGSGDKGGSGESSGGGGTEHALGLGGLSQRLGGEGGLQVDVGLGGDLLVHVGHKLGRGGGHGDEGEENLQ